MRKALLGMLCASMLAAGCDDPNEKVLGIDATGKVLVIAYLDRNDDGAPTIGVDRAFRGLNVALLRRGTTTPIATAVTDSAGAVLFANVPVGMYRVTTLGGTTLGDSVSVAAIEGDTLTLPANDSAAVAIRLAYSSFTVERLETVEIGKRVALNLTALNAWTTFGDSTIHLADSTGAIRAVSVPPSNVVAGDQLRLLATMSERDGHRVLTDIAIISGATGPLPTPLEATTQQAANASGKFRNAQVRIRKATIVDVSSLPGGDILLRVDDTSGPLEVILDANAAITSQLPIAKFAELELTGLLVPLPNGKWQLKPRRSADVSVSYPPVSIAQARLRPPGEFAAVQAIAMSAMSPTSLGTFGDRSLHLKDASGTIRAFANGGFIEAGDSVSVLGIIGFNNGQVVLNNATVAVLAKRTVPLPDSISLRTARTANGGALDAALVRVADITVIAVDTLAAGDIRLTMRQVRDSIVTPDTLVADTVRADTAEVELDRDAFTGSGFRPPAVGTRVDVSGFLVPLPGGIWMIKPRSPADVIVRQAPQSQARKSANTRSPQVFIRGTHDSL